MVQAAESSKNFEEFKKMSAIFRKLRPTGSDAFYVIEKLLSHKNNYKFFVRKEAERMAKNSILACKRIGKYGAKLIKDRYKILMHCNAGALACVKYGTALSVIRFAHSSGKKIFVFVSETRPRFQGALTSWELLNLRIPHKIIIDSACGYLMKKGEIDMVIVGADRITKNGDVVNKIGTYEIAVLAKENHIPFYVAAPTSTFDMKCEKGEDVVIEERDENEVLYVKGKRIFPSGASVKNPAFDITPVKYITGIITENGILWKNI